MKRRLLAMALLLAGVAAQAEGNGLFTVVRVDTAQQDLRLFWQDDQGQPYRRLDRLAGALKAQRKTLTFGMNAGMYHADASPVGLLVIAGRELAPLNLAGGEGNFFLKPNGVFFIDAQGPHVVDAVDYPAQRGSSVRYATQSGPMLLKGGEINPLFRPSSASRYIRNGVCTLGPQALFVISERPVTFHEFATFFKDELHCQDALYLDGAISSLYSPALGRNNQLKDLGPLIGWVE